MGKCKEFFFSIRKIGFGVYKKTYIFAPQLSAGAIAQLVEQRTENPCVPGSIPGGTTALEEIRGLFILCNLCIWLLNRKGFPIILKSLSDIGEYD